MTRRKRRLLLTSLAAVLAVVGGIVCLPPGTIRNGRADVRVTFAVVDADTGSPVPRAQVLLRRSPDGFAHPPLAPGEWDLAAGRAGTVGYVEPDSPCATGAGGELLYVALPRVWYAARADGYQEGIEEKLDVLDNQGQVRLLPG